MLICPNCGYIISEVMYLALRGGINWRCPHIIQPEHPENEPQWCGLPMELFIRMQETPNKEG